MTEEPRQPTDAEWELALKIAEHVLTLALQIVREHKEADTYPQAPGTFIPSAGKPL